MLAPLCGCSTMSFRSMLLKRPLRARSSLTTCATSKVPAAASAAVKGTIAMGMASSCPRVTSTTNSPRLSGQNASSASNTITKRDLFIGLELNFEISLKQRRIRRLGQRRCAIHGILDGLAHRCIAVAFCDPGTGHLAARHLGHRNPAIDADARRGWFDPRFLNAIAQARDVAIAQRTRFDRIDVLLLGQLAVQFGLALLARMLVHRALELLSLLGCGGFGLRLLLGGPRGFGSGVFRRLGLFRRPGLLQRLGVIRRLGRGGGLGCLGRLAGGS